MIFMHSELSQQTWWRVVKEDIKCWLLTSEFHMHMYPHVSHSYIHEYSICNGYKIKIQLISLRVFFYFKPSTYGERIFSSIMTSHLWSLVTSCYHFTCVLSLRDWWSPHGMCVVDMNTTMSSRPVPQSHRNDIAFL